MRVVRVRIGGAYEDAWLYKDHLLAWTTAGELRAAPLSRLVDIADTGSTDVGTLLALLFIRNDWKASALFRRLVEIRDVELAVDGIAAELEKEGFAFDEHDLFDDESGRLVDGTLLNADIYADGIYLSSTKGFFETGISWPGGQLELPSDAAQRLDKRTVGSSIGYGAVNASCEDDGLFSSFDEFGWSYASSNRDLEQTDDLSYGTSWLGRSLLNWRGDDVRLLHAETETVDGSTGRSRDDRTVIVEYDARRDLRHDLDDALQPWATRQGYDGLTIHRVVANIGAKFVVDSDRGALLMQAVGVSEPDSVATVRSVQRLPTQDEVVLSANKLSAGLIIESETAVHLWQGDGVIELLSLPVVRVRTFPNSIRYRDMALAISENAIHLIGVFAPEVMLPPNRTTRRRRGVD